MSSHYPSGPHEPPSRKPLQSRVERGWTEIQLQVYFESRRPSSAEDIAALTISFQLAYDAICEGLGYPKTAMQVLRIDYPNMSISLAGLGDAVKALGDLIKSVPQAIVDLVTIRGAIKVKRAKLERQLVEEQTRLLEAQRKLREMEASADPNGYALRTEAARAHVEAASANVRLLKERRKEAATGMEPDMKKLAAIRSAARATREVPREIRGQMFVEGVRYRVAAPAGSSRVQLAARVPESDEEASVTNRPRQRRRAKKAATSPGPKPIRTDDG